VGSGAYPSTEVFGRAGRRFSLFPFDLLWPTAPSFLSGGYSVLANAIPGETISQTKRTTLRQPFCESDTRHA
jgi:hypothetical protein